MPESDSPPTVQAESHSEEEVEVDDQVKEQQEPIDASRFLEDVASDVEVQEVILIQFHRNWI